MPLWRRAAPAHGQRQQRSENDLFLDEVSGELCSRTSSSIDLYFVFLKLLWIDDANSARKFLCCLGNGDHVNMNVGIAMGPGCHQAEC